MCAPRCLRDHECDPNVDVQACEGKCEDLLGPRAVYDREDWVKEVRQCALRQACVPDVDQGITTCIRDAWRRLPPTHAAMQYCALKMERDVSCNPRQAHPLDYEHCIDGFKKYSDAVLGELIDCANGPCRTQGGCYFAAVGDDPARWDEKVQKDDAEHAIKRPPPKLVFAGQTLTEARTPATGVSVCLIEPPGDCVVSREDGAFSLVVPPQKEITISAAAEGYVGRLVGVTTAGRSFTDVKLTMPDEPPTRARFAKLGINYPDSGTGSVYVIVEGPPGMTGGVEGITMQMDQRPGPPMFFAPDGAPDPDRKATSTYSHAIYGNLKPGIIELTVGPPDVTCVPTAFFWPSSHPGAVRAPIVAGLQTRLTLQCHR